MSKPALEELITKVEAAGHLDRDLLDQVTTMIRDAFPKAHLELPGTPDLTEEAVHIIDACLPGWTIQLKGKATEPDGHWVCTLRETSSRDDDETIGNGKGPTAGLALVDALIRLAIMRSG